MVSRLDEFDFSQVQIGLFSAGGDLSAEYAPKAAAAGCVVIDNTSQFRYDDDVPLVVPEVNGECVARLRQAQHHCQSELFDDSDAGGAEAASRCGGDQRINVATYQAVSGAGSGGVKELAGQTANLLNAKPIEPDVMPVQIAFNAIPQIDQFQDNGYTKEEMKMVWETHKILETSIRVNPTCVRVPVFFGHSEAVHIETEHKLTAADARALLEQAPGVCLMDEQTPGGYPTAVGEAAGTDPVFVGRIREDVSHDRGLNLWVVSDNVRKGAALNSVQIAEILLNHLG